MTSSKAYYWVACGALYLAFLGLLWPTVSYEPISLDDMSLLREHAGDKSLLDAFKSDHFGHLRPGKNLTLQWLAEDQERIASLRAILLVIALLSGLLVQRLAASLTGSRWLGLAAAACWLLHPCTASTVAWLSASNYVFALFFSLAYVALTARERQPGPFGVLPLVLAHVCLLVAALFLELAVVAPLALWAYRSALQPDRAARSGGRGLAVLGALAATLVGALHLACRSTDVAYRIAEHPRGLLVLSSARYLLKNLALWVWPSRYFGVLIPDHPAQEIAWSIGSWLAVLALLAGAVWLWRRDHLSRFGLVWVGVFLLPLVNLVPLGNTPVAVHYLYFAGVGLALLLCQGAAWALRWARLGTQLGYAPAVVVLALLATWLLESRSSVAAWADNQLLYVKTLENHPNSVEVRANLAASYLDHDQLAEADTLLEESLRIAPNDPALVGNQFELLWRTERAHEGLAFLASHPSLNSFDHQYRKGVLLEMVGRPEEALPIYAAVAKRALDPKLRLVAGYRQATVLVARSRLREARQIIEAMLSEFPGDEQLLLTYRLLIKEEASKAQ